MHVILDNLVATLVGSALILIIGANGLRLQQSSVERTAFHIAKTQTLQFANVLEREMRDIGAGLDENKTIERLSPSRELTWKLPGSDDRSETRAESRIFVTDTLAFWTADAIGNPQLVQYVLTSVDTLKTSHGMVPMHRVTRFVNGVPSGASPANILSFRTELLDAAGVSVGSAVTGARMIRLSFVSGLPFNEEDGFYLRQTHWGFTIRPYNLGISA